MLAVTNDGNKSLTKIGVHCFCESTANSSQIGMFGNESAFQANMLTKTNFDIKSNILI